MFQTLKQTIIFTCCIAWVFAYPFDYSERECRDMFPEALGYDAQLDNNPPFEILLSQNMYTEYAKIDGKCSSICGLYFTHCRFFVLDKEHLSYDSSQTKF